MAVTEKYQAQIRQCPISIVDGGASENNRKLVQVDWRPILHPGEDFPEGACLFYLGMDPTLDPPAWVDEMLRYAPAPVWARSEEYIQYLEAQLKKAQPKK